MNNFFAKSIFIRVVMMMRRGGPLVHRSNLPSLERQEEIDSVTILVAAHTRSRRRSITGR